MAFLKARAERYFFDVYVDWDRLHFQFPRPQTAAHVLEWGRNLSSFRPRISAAGLAGLQVVRGYNQELAQSITLRRARRRLRPRRPRGAARQRGAGAARLARSARASAPAVGGQPAADAPSWPESLLADLLEGMYEGDRLLHRAARPAAPGATSRSAASASASAARTGCARSPTGSTAAATRPTSRSPSAATPACSACCARRWWRSPRRTGPSRSTAWSSAEVEDNRELLGVPPDRAAGPGQGVLSPVCPTAFTSGWAPCARPMAGKGMGFYAVPEKGEQVLVAFEHGDLSRPYVLGSLWSAKQPPPVTDPTGTNAKRVIRSRAGHTITFDDTADLRRSWSSRTRPAARSRWTPAPAPSASRPGAT